MKTLDQLDAKLEKRIPISSLPFTISASGSYYFTGNLQFSAATGDAIAINQSNVTLDLMGFTLSSTAGVTGNAIVMTGAVSNIAVKNGVIAGNTTVTISGAPPNQTWNPTKAGFNVGIVGLNVSSCQFSQLRISGCRNSALNVGNAAAIDHVTASSNGLTGISAVNGSITNSIANSNAFIGISASGGSVTNSTASSNGSTGVSADNGSVTNSTATLNGGTGISASGGSVTNSMANGNGSNGISANPGSITSSTASSNGGTGIFAASGSVTNSTANANGSDGISAANGVVAFCKALNNNTKNNGSLDINATGATRTGNNPTP
ncbi:MAG: hypothetical protein ABR611_05810 [Chthoniobacterales bacterium]